VQRLFSDPCAHLFALARVIVVFDFRFTKIFCLPFHCPAISPTLVTNNFFNHCLLAYLDALISIAFAGTLSYHVTLTSPIWASRMVFGFVARAINLEMNWIGNGLHI